jgi:hypothetical protein
MNFQEVTKMMLNSMDFFELRRTAARYGVAYQGVRRQKLVKDLERKILLKGNVPITSADLTPTATLPSHMPEGAVSAKPKLDSQPKSFGISTFSSRAVLPRPRV